ncbi:MAG: universal stress protein [Spirochaetes bacterium]|nr:universal stress protein [Spirochaetota bacterium]
MNKPVRKIMVYVDGSEESIIAAQYGICFAKSMGAEFFVLYVVNTRALADLVSARIFLEAEEEEYKKDLDLDADRYLNHVSQLAAKVGVDVNLLRASGSISVEIKNATKKHEVDLLIIGELSKTLSRRDELYNETERAMRSVNCSVLIVKDEERVLELYNRLI